MDQNSPPREAVEQLAEEFVARYRRGERPSITEYCKRLPEHEAEIRDLFPALVLMENVAPAETKPNVFGPSIAKAGRKQRQHPEQLGDYRIIREVGRGGMGVVYEAEQISLGRHVALKVLPYHVSKDASALERFRREARAAAKLHHTNIVPVFEVGKVDDVRFYAMQYIPGLSLDHVLEELRRLRSRDLLSKNAEESEHLPAEVATPSSSLIRRERETIAQSLVMGHFLPQKIVATTQEIFSDTPSAAFDLVVDGMSTVNAAQPINKDFQQHVPETVNVLCEGSTSTSASLPGYSDLTSSGSHLQKYYQSVSRIGIQVAEALGYAHDRGVMHRDIKPSNLLLDIAGTVWVTDFGLAKEQEEGLTQTGDIVGTLRYMAPERFRGSGDRRSDIYSLGVTLYELVTLRPAFQSADQLQLVEQMSRAEPVRPRMIDRRIPADLETVILKAIEKDPGRRYQSGQQLAEDLQCFLDCRPIKARRTGWHEHTWRWCRRNPIVATLLTLTAILLVAIAVGSSIATDRIRYQLVLTKRAEEKERNERHERENALFDAYVNQARAERTSHRTGQRFQTLAAVQNALQLRKNAGITRDQKRTLRNEAIGGLILPDIRIVREWPGWPRGTVTIAFDSQQRRYARLSLNREISVREVERDREIVLLKNIDSDGRLQFSPDGRFLSAWCTNRQKMMLWDCEGDVARPMLDEASLSIIQCDFSPDGSLFAYDNGKGDVNLVSLPSGLPVKTLKAAGEAGRLAFHSTKRQLAVVSGHDRVQISDIDSGEMLTEIPQSGVVHNLAWNGDGKTLATVNADTVIRLWNVPEKRMVKSLSGHRQQGIFFGFNHTFDLMLSRDWSGSMRLWDPQQGLQIFQFQADTHIPQFHHDRNQFSTFDPEAGTVQLWEIASGREYRTLIHSDPTAESADREIAISPNGRYLVAGLRNGLAFWDFESGDSIGFVLTGHSERIAFESSGALLSNSVDGVFRWTITDSSDLRIGPRLSTPERLPLAGSIFSISCSHDGRVIATCHSFGATVLHRGNPDRIVNLNAYRDARNLAVSPDGRWVAIGGFTDPGVKVWNASTGELKVELVPDELFNGVGFSPEGRWLITNGRGCRLWNVDDWTESTHIGGLRFAFTNDGRMIAVRTNHGTIRLVDPVTGTDFATLNDPNQDFAEHMTFSPDGRKLVTTGKSTEQMVHVWDLASIRSQLRAMDLDWDLPAIGQEDSSPLQTDQSSQANLTEWGLPQTLGGADRQLILDQEAILQVLREPAPPSIDPHRQAMAHIAAKEWSHAVTEYDAALKQFPTSAIVYNEFAWLLAACPDTSIRHASRAVDIAERAVTLDPNNASIWNTLGVAEYRNGEWRKALETLTKSEEMSPGKHLGDNGFFLAMAYGKLGDRESARTWFARAIEWVEANRETIGKTPTYADELARFRSEAEEFLGLDAAIP